MAGRTGQTRIGPRYFVSEPVVAIRIEDVSDIDKLLAALREVYPDLRETTESEWRAVEAIADRIDYPDPERR